MKFAILFLVAGMLNMACQKESELLVPEKTVNTTVAKDYTVYSENNILVFPTLEDYGSAITELSTLKTYDSWENELGFSSMRTEYKNNNNLTEMPVDDYLFASLINTDGIISIGEHFYKIDMKNNKVFVIQKLDDCTENEQLITDLNSNIKNKKVLTFSTEDDVLGFVTGETENVEKWGTTYCDHRKLGTYSLSAGVGGEKIYWKNVYFKSGIYNSIYAKIWSENGSDYAFKISTKSGSYWKNKYSSGSIYGSVSKTTDELTKTVYSSYRRLTNYRFNVDVQYTAPSYYWQGNNFTRNENNYCIK